MPAPLSKDLRQRVVAAYLAGEGTYEQLARRFSIGTATVSRLLKSQREHGEVGPKGHAGGMPARIQGEELNDLRRMVAMWPERSVEALARIWATRTGKPISRSSMMRALERAGLSRNPKKPHSTLRRAGASQREW